MDFPEANAKDTIYPAEGKASLSPVESPPGVLNPAQ